MGGRGFAEPPFPTLRADVTKTCPDPACMCVRPFWWPCTAQSCSHPLCTGRKGIQLIPEPAALPLQRDSWMSCTWAFVLINVQFRVALSFLSESTRNSNCSLPWDFRAEGKNTLASDICQAAPRGCQETTSRQGERSPWPYCFTPLSLLKEKNTQ